MRWSSQLGGLMLLNRLHGSRRTSAGQSVLQSDVRSELSTQASSL